jgi:hypothetical protein
MSCKLDKGVAFDCDALQQGGIENFFYVLNYSEWKSATVTVDGTTEEISAITLTETGAAAYKFTVPKSQNIIATSVLRAIDGVDGFDDQIDARVNSIEQLDVKNIQRIRFNKIVVIVPLLDGRARIYGGKVDATPEAVGVGMRLSDYQDNQGDAGMGGTIQFIAKTPDTDPPEIYASQLIASDVDLEALLTPVT